MGASDEFRYHGATSRISRRVELFGPDPDMVTIEQLEELYESPEALAKRTDLSADEKREILERWKWSAEFQSAHDPHAGNPSLITLVARLLASPLGDDDLDERLDEALEGQDY